MGIESTPAAPVAPTAPGEGAAPPPEVAAPKKEEEVPFHARFAALARREKAITERERAYKEQSKELESYRKHKATSKDNPLPLLEESGWTYDKLTQFILNDKKLTAEEKLAKLEERLDLDAKKKDEDAKKAETDEAEATIADHKQQIGKFLAENAETFELVAAYGDDGAEQVYAIIEAKHAETGEILPIAEAAQLLEAWLEAEVNAKILKTKKFQPKQEPSQAVETEPKTKGPPPTLTNRSLAGAPPVENAMHLSAEDRKREAAKLLRWDK